MTREDLQRHYKSLEVTPDAPWDDIKRSYRDLMKVWHPDRFAGDKRLQKIVEEKTKELIYAFKKVEEDYHSIKFSTEPQFEDEPIKAAEETKPKPRDKSRSQEKPKRSYGLGRNQEAKEWLKKAKALDSVNYRLVIEYLNQAIELDPFLEEAYIERGKANAGFANYQQAIEDFNEAIKLNSKSFEGFRGRAIAYSETGNPLRAIMDFSSAIELEPVNYPELYYLRGKAHESLGNRADSEEDIKAANVLRILNAESSGSDKLSGFDEAWDIESRRKKKIKEIILYAKVAVCLGLFVAIVVYGYGKASKEQNQPAGTGSEASDLSSKLLEKALSVPAPLPDPYESQKSNLTGETVNFPPDTNGRQKEVVLIKSPPEGENRIGGKFLPVAEPSTKARQGYHPIDRSHRTQQEEIQQARKHKAKRLTASEKNKEETKRDKLQQYEKIKQMEEEFPFEILNKGE